MFNAELVRGFYFQRDSINGHHNRTKPEVLRRVKRVLVGDDDVTMRDMIVANLSTEFPTLQIDTAETGTDALEQLKTGKFHVAFLDNDFGPRSPTGIQIAHINTKGHFVPVVVLITGNREISGRLETRLGLQRIIQKGESFDITDCYDVIRQAEKELRKPRQQL